MTSLSLGVHAAGLISVYSAYGFLQEKILRSSTYGPNHEHFTSSPLLILCNRLFSISVGLALVLFKSRQDKLAGETTSTVDEFRKRLIPKSPFSAYAAVAGFNFLSTTCQYEALRYVSYTTQSLAKTAKMVPVLVVGFIVYRKKYSTKEWVAGAVLLAGCTMYVFATPPPAHKILHPQEQGLFSTVVGSGFLLGYLFFDGLVSTTQERVFGKNPSSSDPFGKSSPVLDQMIWTNVFAALIATGVALLSSASGSLWPNVTLMLTSPTLVWDICVFSASSSLGLLILLNTIASFGALTCSIIMTCRQFISILINAAIFGTFAATSAWGWCGVGWVASGVWIKMNRKYDASLPPRKAREEEAQTASRHSTTLELGEMKEDSVSSPLLGRPTTPLSIRVPGSPIADGPSSPARSSTSHESMGGTLAIASKARQYLFQYGVPFMIPPTLATLLGPYMETIPIA